MENAVRNIVGRGAFQQAAVAAVAQPAVASLGVVADARHGPHIVERPHDLLSRIENLFEVAEREHRLIDPVQMYHVGLFEQRQARDVSAVGGGVDGKEVFPAETVRSKDFRPLGNEAQLLPAAFRQAHNSFFPRAFVAAQQRSLLTVLAQGFQQPHGGNGCAAFVVGGIY